MPRDSRPATLPVREPPSVYHHDVGEPETFCTPASPLRPFDSQVPSSDGEGSSESSAEKGGDLDGQERTVGDVGRDGLRRPIRLRSTRPHEQHEYSGNADEPVMETGVNRRLTLPTTFSKWTFLAWVLPTEGAILEAVRKVVRERRDMTTRSEMNYMRRLHLVLGPDVGTTFDLDG